MKHCAAQFRDFHMGGLTLLMGTCDVGQVVVVYEVITANVCDFVVFIAEHILAPKSAS